MFFDVDGRGTEVFPTGILSFYRIYLLHQKILSKISPSLLIIMKILKAFLHKILVIFGSG